MTLFDGTPADQQTTPANPADNSNPLLTKVMEIKNENGQPKYDTLEKAIDALVSSQTYIPTLKTEIASTQAELAAAKAKLEAAGNVEEIVKSLLPKPDAPIVAPTTEKPEGLNEQGVADIVSQKLAEQAQAAQAAANENKVVEALTAKFGEKAKEALAAKAKELNTTPQELGKLSVTSPDMVISLFNQGGSAPSTPTSPINSSGFQSTPDVGLKKPEKSVLSGATLNDQVALWRDIKEHVHKKFDVTT